MPLPDPVDLPDSVESNPAEELDDPYIHIVSTEAFVEAVETAGQQEEI